MASSLSYSRTEPAPIPEGSQCMKAEVTSGSANAYIKRTRINSSISYVHQWIYIAAEGLGDGEAFKTLQLLTVDEDPVAEFRFYDDSGTLKWEFCCHDGNSSGGLSTKVTGQTSIETGTWYQTEYKYDISANAWEVRLDGATVTSGSLTGSDLYIPKTLATGIIGNEGSNTTTVYIDHVVWDTLAWTGLPAGSVTETITFADTEGALLTLYPDVSESMAFEGTESPLLTLYPGVSDAVVLGDTPSPLLTYTPTSAKA